ncbi:MAG: DUF664 domain-containing protein [Armatimonadetes bacterium]|nr:DUF664 domain-containing protein [Armatimonadota bacterium]
MIDDLDILPSLDPQIAVLRGALIDSTREWRQNLGRVSQDAVVWQCFPDGPSIGGLLLHLIDVEQWWIQEVAAGKELDAEHAATVFNNGLNQYKPFWPAPPKKPLSWFLQLHDETRVRVLALIESEIDASRMVQRRRMGQFSHRWILSHVVQHDSYTGGQAVLLNEMYKRLRRGSKP